MATQEQKDRANGVLKATQKYYDNKGFQRGYAKDKNGKVVTEYYGIKTLQLLTHEETVRNNKINEELQRQQVEAAKSQAGAAWASANTAKREFNLRVAMTNEARISDIYNRLTSGAATRVDSNTIRDQDGIVYREGTDKTGSRTLTKIKG
jgi:uncharacterized protein YifE (UPF0438 family)